MTDRLVIYLLLAGCLIFGAVVWAELQPAAVDTPAPSQVAKPADTPAATHRQPSTRLEELLATVLARPLFSNTRRPPQSTASDNVASSDLNDVRLTGIVTEPERRVAIFAVNGAKPLRLTEGEAVSGWRIETITPREVSLSGPGGTKTLEPKLDPNLVQQPAPALPANAAVRPPIPTPAANPAARLPPQPAGAAAANAPPRPGIPPGLPAPPQVRPGRVRAQP
jgi:general secretion pathway protein N